MSETLDLGPFAVEVVRKRIKHVHLSVHPPAGEVRISAPARLNREAIRAFALSKLGWIRRQQERMREHVRVPLTVWESQRCGQIEEAAPPLIAEWEPRLGVKIRRLVFRRMKARWGSCNPTRRTVCLNTELSKRPRECLEYVIVHELAHLLEPTHNARFKAIMDRVLPRWREARELLDRYPILPEHVGSDRGARSAPEAKLSR